LAPAQRLLGVAEVEHLQLGTDVLEDVPQHRACRGLVVDDDDIQPDSLLVPVRATPPCVWREDTSDRPPAAQWPAPGITRRPAGAACRGTRSEEHTSELQSRENLVC